MDFVTKYFKSHKKLNEIDKKITKAMDCCAVDFLRWSLGIVFIWFGILKPLGMSPAQDLVAKTVFWFDPIWFFPFLGWWEVAIGVCLIYKPLIRLGIFLMAMQMVGTFFPLVLLPEITYGPIPVLTLTLEGQYIIKNIVLIAAAIAVGSHVRDE